MIKLNRTTEYGLMALRHMSRKKNADLTSSDLGAGTGATAISAGVTSAREVSDAFGIPFDITAKTLQRLKDTGLIQSSQGARGGYTLARALREVSLAEFLQLMEGPQSVVACAGANAPALKEKAADAAPACNYEEHCELKHVMGDLNARVLGFLSGIPLATLAEGPAAGTEIFLRTPAPVQVTTFPFAGEEP